MPPIKPGKVVISPAPKPIQRVDMDSVLEDKAERVAQWLHSAVRRLCRDTFDPNDGLEDYDTLSEDRKTRYRRVAMEMLTNPPPELRGL